MAITVTDILTLTHTNEIFFVKDKRGSGSGSGSLNNGDYIRYVYNYVLLRSRFSVSRVSEDLVGRCGCESAVWAS